MWPFGSRKQSGDAAEDRAAAALREAGYRILERNVSIGGGELDLVAREGGTLVFVEVRSRTGAGHGSAAESVTRKKAVRIARAARAYLASRRLDGAAARCDLVTLDGSPGVDVPRIEIHRDCIDLDGALRGGRWAR
jgi:putative endonuclease